MTNTLTLASKPRSAALFAWLRLARVFHKVDQATAEHLRAYDLSVAQFDVLAHVGVAEGLTQQELADSLLVTKGNVCQLLGRMERDGLIERTADGRANRIALTPHGRRLFEAVVPAQERLVVELFGALSGEEQTHLLALLRTLDRALG